MKQDVHSTSNICGLFYSSAPLGVPHLTISFAYHHIAQITFQDTETTLLCYQIVSRITTARSGTSVEKSKCPIYLPPQKRRLFSHDKLIWPNAKRIVSWRSISVPRLCSFDSTQYDKSVRPRMLMCALTGFLVCTTRIEET